MDEPYRWEAWAAPKDLVGKLDHHNALTGDDLRDFVNLKLFPYLHGFKMKTFPRIRALVLTTGQAPRN